MPNQVEASGNAKFNLDDIFINSGVFNYFIESNQGVFSDYVEVKFLDSVLTADQIKFDTKLRFISGQNNIEFNAPNVIAKSDYFYIDDDDLITLRDNVYIEEIVVKFERMNYSII